MNKTAIEWCDFTANPIRYRDDAGKSVWACLKASEGCQHCYAEALAHRYQGREFTAKAMEGVTPYVDERELRAMLSTTKLPAGSRVFVGDMTDVFGPWVPFDLLDLVFAVFALRPDVVFQVLTKRPERMREYLHKPATEMHITGRSRVDEPAPWPLTNVWLGVSAENQHWADVRIPELLATPAAVRFVSAEPLLGEVRFDIARENGVIYALAGERSVYRGPDGDEEPGNPYANGARIDWVIVGGESGPGARPCDVGWIRSIVWQCQVAGTKVFVKQLGAKPLISLDDFIGRPVPPGKRWLTTRKGGDMDEWPEDLRVREWPLSTEAKR